MSDQANTVNMGSADNRSAGLRDDRGERGGALGGPRRKYYRRKVCKVCIGKAKVDYKESESLPGVSRRKEEKSFLEELLAPARSIKGWLPVKSNGPEPWRSSPSLRDKESPLMKVILYNDVPNLGEEGDIKIVADGYARNYLIPRKFAVRYTKATEVELAQKQQAITRRKTEKTASGCRGQGEN